MAVSGSLLWRDDHCYRVCSLKNTAQTASGISGMRESASAFECVLPERYWISKLNCCSCLYHLATDLSVSFIFVSSVIVRLSVLILRTWPGLDVFDAIASNLLSFF